MLGSPLDQLCSSVDPEGCHLHRLPERIWVFGGQIELDPTLQSESLRNSFYRQTLLLPPTADGGWLARIDIPENHKDWWEFSGYDDLLQFERDACYLAQATVLFAESSGSLAELGALAIDETLVDHLIVVVQTHYFDTENRRSFLNLGPLKRVRNRHHLCTIGAAEKERTLPSDDVQSIVESVSKWLPQIQKTKVFETSNPTHRLLLLADLVDILLVSKSDELKTACTYFGVTYSDSELTKALKLLAFFEMVRIEPRGLEMFYVRRNASGAPWVNYTGNAKIPFDRSRFKIDCSAFIDLDPRRKVILERAR